MSALRGRPFLYLSVITGNLLALSAGVWLTWTSPVLPQLTQSSRLSDNPFGETISEEEASWVGSLLALGACLGPPLAGFLADKIGRKPTLLALGVPSVLGFFTLAFSKTVYLYYVARFLGGISIGAAFILVPMYISEVAEDSIRGTLSSSMNCFVTFGTLFSYAIGPYVSIMWFCIICAVIPTLFLVGFFLYVPESPYYLTKKNKLVAAEASLSKFRGGEDSEVKVELAGIRTAVNSEASASLSDIFKSRGTVKALIISLALMAFQQLSGINIVLFYAEDIFKASGSSIAPAVASIIIGLTQFGASFITPIFVDRLGRRILLLISAGGMLVFEVAIGVYFYMQEQKEDVSSLYWLPVLCLVGYILTYNTGFGPLPWVVMAEVFPGNVKSYAAGIGGSFCWFVSFLLTKFFATASKSMGMGGSFWLFSGFNVLAMAFVALYLPETKGKSLQEILNLLNAK